jgi:putative transposase
VANRSKKTHDRRSLRLAGWDYSSNGAYFVTVSTWDRHQLFGQVVNGNVHLNETGRLVADTWQWLGHQYSHVCVDEWCVMPNHLHGILVLSGDEHDSGRGGSRTAPTSKRKPVGRLIGAFKTVSTKQINLRRQTPGARVWQRDFWEHIVRDDAEMDRIRQYIKDNPANWETDDLRCHSDL